MGNEKDLKINYNIQRLALEQELNKIKHDKVLSWNKECLNMI